MMATSAGVLLQPLQSVQAGLISRRNGRATRTPGARRSSFADDIGLLRP